MHAPIPAKYDTMLQLVNKHQILSPVQEVKLSSHKAQVCLEIAEF